jgi:hypothetical protein
MSRELTRRDALVALAAIGSAAGGTTAYLADRRRGDLDDVEGPGEDSPSTGRIDEREMETLVAIAKVIYPSAVSGITPFVERFMNGRVAARPALAAGISASTDRLDRLAREWYGSSVSELAPEDLDGLLREAGVDTADPAPDGSPAERMRYFLVNELLYGLYASPTGGTLLGLENPQGHPGGLDSYQQGPEE